MWRAWWWAGRQRRQRRRADPGFGEQSPFAEGCETINSTAESLNDNTELDYRRGRANGVRLSLHWRCKYLAGLRVHQCPAQAAIVGPQHDPLRRCAASAVVSGVVARRHRVAPEEDCIWQNYVHPFSKVCASTCRRNAEVGGPNICIRAQRRAVSPSSCRTPHSGTRPSDDLVKSA